MTNRFRIESRAARYYGLPHYSLMLWRRVSTRLQRYLLRQRYVMRSFSGFRMYLDLEDRGISRTLAIAGSREEDQIAILESELQEGMVVLDIGSNIGFYPLLASTLVGQTGKVYGAEPSPQNYQLFTRNVELNGLSRVIESLPVGISDRTGKATFYLHERANLHTLNPTKYHTFKTQTRFDAMEIDIVGISDFIRDNGPVDLIRMDIEGHEVEVLEGLIVAVQRDNASPRVLFENHFPKYDDASHSIRAPLRRLFELGYYAKTMVSTDESVSKFHAKGYSPQRTVKTDGIFRGLYEGVSNADAIEFICDIGYVRATLLGRARPGESS